MGRLRCGAGIWSAPAMPGKAARGSRVHGPVAMISFSLSARLYIRTSLILPEK